VATIKCSSDWVTSNLFSVVPDVELRDILDKAAKLYNTHPEIEAAIRHDQMTAAVEKRAERDADREWVRHRTEPLSDIFDTASVESMARRPLGEGRSRMSPVLVFVFSLLRGVWGSVTDRVSWERVKDSITLRTFLSAHGERLPARSTVHENVNVLSEETLETILTAQLNMAFDEGLDDFSRYCQDSTAVEANSRWPTDSGFLKLALHRACHYGRNLDKIALPDFRPWTMPRWLRRVRRLDFEINTTAGKPGSKKKIEKRYRELVEVAEKLISRLEIELDRVRALYDGSRLLPSKRRQCDAVLRGIADDIQDARILICNIDDRVFQGRKLESWQRIPSRSDRSAAFICKGDRVPIVGYRPQLVRSGNGFVAHLSVPEGNAADSPQLVESIDAAIRRTDCGPIEVSVDDGYASKTGLEALCALGIERVSISGSKGKKLIGIEDWESPEYRQARNDRSAVESLMFTLKYTVHFGRLRRRGIKAVRCELLEKVIAYNFARMVVLEDRGKRKLPLAA